MVQYYALLSVSLTSWAIFMAKLVNQTSTGVFIGYLTSPVLMVAVSALSLFVLPIPSKLPFGMLLLPQAGGVRFFYSVAYNCLSTTCIDTIYGTGGEDFRSVVGLVLGIILTMGLTLAPSLNSVVDKVKSILKGKATKSTLSDTKYMRDSTVDEFEMSALALSTSQHVEYPLIVKNLCKNYYSKTKTVNALKNFTFKLNSKSVFGLLGPNGAGKSTFLKIVCGSLKDFIGEVYIEGKAAQQIKDV